MGGSGGGGQGCLGGVSRCHSIDWLPKLWLLHSCNCLSNFLFCRSISAGMGGGVCVTSL